MAHDNAILRHFVANITFLGGPDCQGKRIQERKASFSNRETLEQYYSYSNFPLLVVKLSKHIPTVHKTPDSLLMIWFQSCIAWSPAYCLDHLIFLVAIISVFM